MTLHWPQIFTLSLWALRIAIHIDKNGKPTGSTYGGGSAILSAALWAIILYYGGFWTGSPQ